MDIDQPVVAQMIRFALGFGVMIAVAMGAILIDRPAITMRGLAVAALIVTLLTPEAVLTPGFQMSFAASAGLIALYEIWPKLGRIEQRGIVMRVPLEGGGRLVVELTPDEARDLGAQLSTVAG